VAAHAMLSPSSQAISAVEWRDIPHCTGYQVSNTGELRNSRTGYLIKRRHDKNGYLLADLWIAGRVTVKVHRIVASAFLQNQGKPQINHINGNRADNSVRNLEWATPAENIQHAFKVLGRKAGNERPVVAEKDNLRVVFPSVLAAARSGFHRGGIYHCLNGNYRQHKGFQWRYA